MEGIIIAVVVGVVAFVGLYIFVDREIYFYEGTRLGARIQGWLYDTWAAGYDAGKAESQARDKEMLAQPILDFVKGTPTPMVLDLATGTGRLAFALLREPAFTGHIIAVDVSQGMLQQTARKLKDYPGRFELLRHHELPLPFPDESFDVVCCMEALEIMNNSEDPLRELYRVLKPGGMLLSSRATEASGRKGKVMPVEDFKALLRKVGFVEEEVVPWWRVFDWARAYKPGNSGPVGSARLAQKLVCASCRAVGKFEADTNGLVCGSCQHKVGYLDGKILLN